LKDEGLGQAQVLVIDDDPMNVGILQGMLGARGILSDSAMSND